jgi:dephospho-CoA kinase
VPRVKRLILGLAGGVGSGKSAVADLFRKLRGARVIDADLVGHRVLGRPAVKRRLTRTFGPGILGRDGRVDRSALARAAFRSKEAAGRLNRATHPAILREIRRELAASAGWVVLDASLLFESGADALCDRVVFVDAPPAVRAQRTALRGWAPGERERRERLQASPKAKRRKSDYVVDNSGPRERTARQVRRIVAELDRLGG